MKKVNTKSLRLNKYIVEKVERTISAPRKKTSGDVKISFIASTKLFLREASKKMLKKTENKTIKIKDFPFVERKLSKPTTADFDVFAIMENKRFVKERTLFAADFILSIKFPPIPQNTDVRFASRPLFKV